VSGVGCWAVGLLGYCFQFISAMLFFPSGGGSIGNGPKWLTVPCSESAAQERRFHPQRITGLLQSPSGDPGEESPTPEQLRDPICV